MAFALALNQALNGLGLTQLAFAKAIGLSHSMVTKLLSGEEAHRKTYVKIFAYFRDVPSRRTAAKRLMEAYLRDVVNDIGMDDEYSQADLTVSTTRDAVVSHVFHGLPVTILAAFYAIGPVAKQNDTVHNGLMSLAEIAGELGPKGGTEFPKQFFSAALHKPAGSRRLLGGSLGDLFSKLGAPED